MDELAVIKRYLVNEMIAASDSLTLKRFQHHKTPSIETAISERLAAANLQLIKDELASLQPAISIAA